MRLDDYKLNFYSQSGEDGMLSLILQRIGVHDRVCVEFGASQGFDCSNTANLWTNDARWTAHLIEGSPDRYAVLQESVSMYPNVTAELRMVTSEYLNQRFADTGITVMSIDIDGDDYFILEGLEIRPKVLLIEFNATIPAYLDVFPSAPGQSMGCSTAALKRLAEAKGYTFIGMTDLNAFFVLSEFACAFEDTEKDLEKLFNPKMQLLNYACTTYSGEVFFVYKPETPYHLAQRGDDPVPYPWAGWRGITTAVRTNGCIVLPPP